MREKSSGRKNNPDRQALRIAARIQEAVKPDIVILFGSRALGDYREDSHVDILVIPDKENHLESREFAAAAANSHMR